MTRPLRLISWVAIAAAAFAFAWFGFFFFRDNFATHYPIKVLSAEMLRSGEIPWWNPNDGGGQPLAGNPNTLTFYPTTLLYLILPAHVAFNLHFLLHLAGGWLAMRALCRTAGGPIAAVAATIYLLSGVVISATAFYNLVTAVALIPLALLGAERRSARIVGAAFGLMLLAAEPVTLLGAAIAVAFVAAGRMRLASLVIAVALALAIGAPQIIAWSEIASEVERAAGVSARTVLNTSLSPLRVAEIFVWPFSGFLNDAGGVRSRLFSTLFIGIIAVPALFARSRYTAAAVVLLLLAIGANNPLVRIVVENVDAVRVMRFPEKFALPLTVVLAVLVGAFLQRTRFKMLWSLITLVPLIVFAARALPVDRFAPYDMAPGPPRRVHVARTLPSGKLPARDEYRQRAKNLEPLFGAVTGLHYVIHRSPDRMHSWLSRVVVERKRVHPQRYLAVALGPEVRVIPRTTLARDLKEAIPLFERGENVAPRSFVSAPASVRMVSRHGFEVTGGPALIQVNQSYFRAWRAVMDGVELDTLPVNIDRLGVIVPRSGRVVLTFGRNRGSVGVTWAVSLLLLAGVAFAERVKKLDRGAGEIERAADEH